MMLPLLRSIVAALAIALCVVSFAPRAEAQATRDYDVVVYGGTSAGVSAAVQAARLEKSVALIEPTGRIGGLSTNGLGRVDSGTIKAIQGMAREFYARVHNHAGDWRTFNGDLNHTPSAALATFETMLAEVGVEVFLNERLDRASGVTKEGNQIVTIRMESGLTFAGKVFIDAGYEGDLLAAAGVSYTVGREPNSQYGETWNGVQIRSTNNFNSKDRGFSANISPYVVKNDPTSGYLPWCVADDPGPIGSGDRRVQAYNYRLALTKASNRRPWVAPEGYNPDDYEMLRRVVLQNKVKKAESLFRIVGVGSGKYDMNNNGPVSTDFIGENYEYPEASYERRQEILDAHRNYQQGLIYFLAHDPSMPKSIRDSMNSYGLAADEFVENDGWSEQIYVREARRMIGEYVMTDRNILGKTDIDDSIGLGSYNMDSHNTQRLVINAGQPNAYLRNEGDVQIASPKPYRISYRSITPKADQASNLLVTSALSASHIAYGSIRMEPVFMSLGQAAGVAATLAIDAEQPVQSVDYRQLRKELIAGGALLEWPANLE